MATVTKTRSPKQVERRVQMSRIINGNFALHLAIGTGEKVKHFGYYVQPIPADFGLGFRFEKFGTEQEEGKDSAYDVNIDPQRGYHSCTCKGNTYHGHCKHVESVLALIQSGKLTAPVVAKPQPWCDLCHDNPDVFCERCSL